MMERWNAGNHPHFAISCWSLSLVKYDDMMFVIAVSSSKCNMGWPQDCWTCTYFGYGSDSHDAKLVHDGSTSTRKMCMFVCVCVSGLQLWFIPTKKIKGIANITYYVKKILQNLGWRRPCEHQPLVESIWISDRGWHHQTAVKAVKNNVNSERPNPHIQKRNAFHGL